MFEGRVAYCHIEFVRKRSSAFHMPKTPLNLDSGNSLFWSIVRSPVNQRPKSHIGHAGNCRLALRHPWSLVSPVARMSAKSCLRAPYSFPRTFRVPVWCLESLPKLHWSLLAWAQGQMVASGFHQLLLEEPGQSAEDRLALRLFKVKLLKGSWT